VIVNHLGLLHLQKITRIGRGRLRIDSDLVGIQDILGGEGLAVMPADVFAQMKGNDEAVPGNLPRFGQIADDVHIFVVLDQAVEDQSRDLVGRGIGGQQRDQVRGVADGALDDDVPVGGRNGSNPDRCVPRRLRTASRDDQGKE
jgi:hypothetical protein